MVGGDLLFKALVAFALALLSAFSGEPAIASTVITTSVPLDVVTSPILRESNLIAGVADAGDLVAHGYALGVSPYGGAGPAFTRTIEQAISNAGSNIAKMDIVEGIIVSESELGAAGAAFCFTGPVQAAACLATGVTAAYLSSYGWEYATGPDGLTKLWTKLGPSTSATCSFTSSVVPYNACFAAAQTWLNAHAVVSYGTGATAGAIWQTPYSSLGGYQFHAKAYNAAGVLVNTDWQIGSWQNLVASTQAMPGTQSEMAADIAAQDANQKNDPVNNAATLASWLMSQGQPLPIDSSATATLTPTTPTVSASSTVTNLDGSTTTTTDVYSANCTSGSISAVQCAFNATTTSGNAVTSTNNLPNTATQGGQSGQAQESKQCGFDSGDACFVKPTDSFTAPTVGNAKSFQQSASDFYSAVSSAPLLAPLSGLSIGSAPCPVYTLTIPYLHNTSYTIDAHCTILATAGPAISATMYVVWTLIAALILLSA